MHVYGKKTQYQKTEDNHRNCRDGRDGLDCSENPEYQGVQHPCLQDCHHIPVILVGSDYWQGLIDWFHDTLVTAGTIAAADLQLYQVIDTPEDVVNAIFDYYEHKGFEPSEQEREKLLDL